jgi:predicted ester cyclase
MLPEWGSMMDRRSLLASAVAAGSAFAVPASARAQGAPGSLIDRFAAALSAHDLVAFAALYAEDFVNHQVSAAAPAPPATISAKRGSVNFFAARLAGIPDLRVTVEAAVVTSDRVAGSFVYTGTHGGTYLGVAPTGRPLRFTSCDIFLVRNGLLAEHWGMGDIAGILAQLHASG